MAISGQSKVAYIYDGVDWHPISGVANTSADYEWSGDHHYNPGTTVTMDAVLDAKAGVNNYQNPNLRDLAITSPISGIVAFVRQDNAGNTINQLQYYNGGKWQPITSANFLSKSTNFSILEDMIGSTIKVNASSGTTITVEIPGVESFPIGSKVEILSVGDGNVKVAMESGSSNTLVSKYNDFYLAAKYAAAVIIKLSSTEWLLLGDLWTVDES